MDANTLKAAAGSALDAAGAELKLDRVTIGRGHGFDESDDSYRRRLLAQMVGAAAAGAISQPADEPPPPLPPPNPVAPQAAESKPPIPPASQASALRTDGPTVEEWVMAGFDAKKYPPTGYAARSSDDEVKAAVAAQAAAQAHVPHENADANHVDPAAHSAAVGPGAVQQGNAGGDGESASHPTALP